MDKLLLFPGRTDKGIFSYVIDAEKSYLEKTASEYHPTIASYINAAKPIKGKTQVLLTALGASEYWGCFPEGTPITLADGSEKAIELVEEGEFVKTHTSASKPVLEPMGRYYEGDLLTFGFRSWGSELTCTTEHPIYGIKKEDLAEARKGYYKQKESYEEFISKLPYSFIRAEDLRLNDYVCVPFPAEENGHLALQDESLAYVFGRYLADGVLVNRHDKAGDCIHTIVMVIGSDKKEDAEKIVSIVAKYGHKCSLIEKNSEHTVRLTFTWSDFAGTCLYHLGKGSKTKFISDEILRMPRSWQREFLNGYLSGDGCQTLAEGRYYGAVRSSTASERIAAGICKIVARLGYSSGYFKCKQHHTCTYSPNSTIYENSYERSFSKELQGRFVSVESASTSCSSYVDEARGYILLPIKAVSSEHFEGTVYNLHVADDNSYVANNIAVHNCNVNGDAFPETALAHEGDDYGYKTFEKYARLYRHHINKPTSEAYGEVLLSVYNPVFHRVELIVTFNHTNAYDLAEKINAGEAVDFSMGCKVPYDICNICGNKAPTRAQYCEHLRYNMGRFIPSLGKIAYAINTMPKFFDISVVLIGADRIAKSLRKVAAPYGNIPVLSSAYLAEKMAEKKKEATITKEVPADEPPASVDKIKDLARTITEVKAMEPPMPRHVLDSLASQPLPRVMSTMIMMGILPKPQEFQRIYLVGRGHRDLADRLDEQGMSFDPMSVENPSQQSMDELALGHRNFDSGIMDALKPFMADRSYAAPYLGRRLVIMVKRGQEYPLPKLIKLSQDEKKKVPGPLLPLLAAAGAYAVLLRQAPKEALTGLNKILATPAGVGLAAVLGVGMIKMFNTVAGPKAVGQFSQPQATSNPDTTDIFSRIEELKAKPLHKVGTVDPEVLGAAAKRLFFGVPAAYMASGVLQKHKELSPYDEEGRVHSFVRQHPGLISAALIADAMLSAHGHPLSSHALLGKARGWGSSVVQKAKNWAPSHSGGFAKSASTGYYEELEKIADAQDFLSSSVIWPMAMGKTNLPGRIVEGLFDQAAMEVGSKLLKKRREQSQKAQLSGNS